MVSAWLQKVKEHEDFLPALKEWRSLPHADKLRIYTRLLDWSKSAEQPALFEILQNRFRSYSEYNEFFANCQVIRARSFFLRVTCVSISWKSARFSRFTFRRKHHSG